MYILNWKNPSLPGKGTPIVVPVGAYERTATSISLSGKGAANYGVEQQTNLLNLLENFADSVEPRSPTIGQIWYNSGKRVLSVCVSIDPLIWRECGWSFVSNDENSPPIDPALGDFWILRTGSASVRIMVYTGIGRYPDSDGSVGGWEQLYPTPTIVGGRPEYDALVDILKQIGGSVTTGGNGLLEQPSVKSSFTDMNALDLATRQRYNSIRVEDGPDKNVVTPDSLSNLLEVTPNSQDWDKLLAVAKLVVSRLNLPTNFAKNISTMPFVVDGRQAPDSLLALNPSDVRYPSQERRINKTFGIISLSRAYTETYNTLQIAAQNRYSICGIDAASGPYPQYNLIENGGTIKRSSIVTLSGNTSETRGISARIKLTFSDTEQRLSWLNSGGVLEITSRFTASGTTTTINQDFTALLDTINTIRITADNVRTLTRGAQMTISHPYSNKGFTSAGMGMDTELGSYTNGTVSCTVKAMLDGDDLQILISFDVVTQETGGILGNVNMQMFVVSDELQMGGVAVFKQPNVFVKTSDVMEKSSFLAVS